MTMPRGMIWIRKLQPGAVISVKAPDVRWVGNEGGAGGRTTREWSVVAAAVEPPDKYTWPDRQDQDLAAALSLPRAPTLVVSR